MDRGRHHADELEAQPDPGRHRRTRRRRRPPRMNTFDRIVITGGGGMLAHALQRSLRARGLSGVAPPRAACDVSSAADVKLLFREHQPTLLLNCAAYTKVDLCEKESEQAIAVNA